MAPDPRACQRRGEVGAPLGAEVGAPPPGGSAGTMVTGRRRWWRRWSRAPVAGDPGCPAAEARPWSRNVRMSRAIWSHASDATSSGVVTDQTAQAPQQAGLDLPIQHAERVLVPFARRRDGRRQVDRVVPGAHPCHHLIQARRGPSHRDSSHVALMALGHTFLSHHPVRSPGWLASAVRPRRLWRARLPALELGRAGSRLRPAAAGRHRLPPPHLLRRVHRRWRC